MCQDNASDLFSSAFFSAFQSCFIHIMGAIHKMAATLEDSPAAMALRGNFYGQPGLPHLAKHFFPGFLVLLPVKKPHTNENLSGSTPPSRHNADFCFHRATISDTERSERTCLCQQPMTVEQRRRWRRYFGKTELISMHGVTQRSQGSQCVFNLQEDFFTSSLIVERWRLSFSCSFRCLWLSPLYTCTSDLARSGRREVAVRR